MQLATAALHHPPQGEVWLGTSVFLVAPALVALIPDMARGCSVDVGWSVLMVHAGGQSMLLDACYWHLLQSNTRSPELVCAANAFSERSSVQVARFL